jgi:hypothetical protein
MSVAYQTAIIFAMKEINRRRKLSPSMVFALIVLEICGIKQTKNNTVAVHPSTGANCIYISNKNGFPLYRLPPVVSI